MGQEHCQLQAMLGVALLSEYNELIHAFGNASFRQHFFGGRSYSEGHGRLSNSSGVSSTTSCANGCHPASHNNSREQIHRDKGETVEENNNMVGTTGQSDDKKQCPEDEQIMLDESLLLSQLMPLASLCRARSNLEDGCQNQIKCIQSGLSLQVQIGNLPFSNLLFLIYTQNAFRDSSDRLFRSLLRCIDFHYGPQLHLITLSTPLVQQLQRRCEQRMLGILERIDAEEGLNQQKKVTNDDGEEDIFNQDLLFGGTHQFIQSTLMPKLQNLTKMFAQRIGARCKCLFLHSGRLIASNTSHPPSESAITSILPDQLHSILQFSRQNEGCVRTQLKSQTEQTWLHSKTLRRRQLHNLFVLSLDEHVEMICLAPAEHFQLIGSIIECLELLEQIGSDYLSNELPSLIGKCQKHLESGQKLLEAFSDRNVEWFDGEMLVKGGGWSQWDYLHHVHKTRALIQQLWGRFRCSLDTYQHQISPSSSAYSINRIVSQNPLCASSQSLLTEGSGAQQAQYNSTISSVYSTLEWSTLSATFSSTSHLPAVQLDAMRTQLKRVLRALLNELLTWSSGLARAQTLPQLQAALRHIIGHQLVGAFLALEEKMDRSLVQSNPLKPTHLGLDMFAYRFAKADGPPLYFQYAGACDEQKELFLQMMEALPMIGMRSEDEKECAEISEEMMIARTSDGELLLQFRTSCSPLGYASTKKRTLLSRLSFGGLTKVKQAINARGDQGLQQSYNVIVLFSRHINTSLAMKQAQKLINLLAEGMEECQQSFH